MLKWTGPVLSTWSYKLQFIGLLYEQLKILNQSVSSHTYKPRSGRPTTSDTLWFKSCDCSYKTELLFMYIKSSSSSVNSNLPSNAGLSRATLYCCCTMLSYPISRYTSSETNLLMSMTENVISLKAQLSGLKKGASLFLPKFTE